jgi:2-methylaconitate cis-trans-isomerase PrpF
MLPSIRPTPASDSPAAEQSSEEQLSKIFKDCSTSSCASLFRRLGAFLEFEATDIAVADHALIVNYVAADDLGHHGHEIHDELQAYKKQLDSLINEDLK